MLALQTVTMVVSRKMVVCMSVRVMLVIPDMLIEMRRSIRGLRFCAVIF